MADQQSPAYPPIDPAYPPPINPEYPPQQAYPPPQQAAYPPQQQQQATTTVVVQQPAVVQAPVFKDRPVVITDSKGQQVTTQLEFKSGILTWLICCLICWFTGLWCIAPIIFCVDATKDVYHISPTDGTVVGVYKRL